MINTKFKWIHTKNEAYNKGIEDAIRLVQEFSKTNSPMNDPFLLFHNLMSKLKSLKK